VDNLALILKKKKELDDHITFFEKRFKRKRFNNLP